MMKFDQLCHRVNDQTVLHVSKTETTFAFRGRVNILVLSGKINILGFNINFKSGTIPVISPSANSAYTVNVLQNVDRYAKKNVHNLLSQLDLDEKKIRKFLILCKKYCVILFTNYESSLDDRIRNALPKLFKPRKFANVISYSTKKSSVNFLDFILMDEKIGLIVPDSWKELLLKIQEAYLVHESNLRILVCGGKNSGKSTLLTFLINSLLNECDSLYHLELDPGQPEFVPPGILALTLVDKPLLEPKFLHQKSSLCSYFAGGVNIMPFPKHYVHCINELNKNFTCLYNETPKPLLINTMGFTQGVGLHLLHDIFSIVQPTHVIQIYRNTRTDLESQAFTSEYFATINGWVNTSDKKIPAYDFTLLQTPYIKPPEQEKKAKLFRNLGIYSYFTTGWENQDLKLLINATKPYKVAFSDVALFCCNLTVTNHEIMYAMNGKMVALCRSNRFDELSSADKSLPKFLDTLPDGEWIGYAIIRGIDVNAKMFYVITPVAQEELRKVNVFLKTEIDLPEELIIDQKTIIPSPYVVGMQVKNTMLGKRILGKRTIRKSGGFL